MKNENVHMQALHRKLDVVLVQILPYSCSETNYSFCKDSTFPAGLRPLPGRGFHRQIHLAPTIFVLWRPWQTDKPTHGRRYVKTCIGIAASS